MPPRLNKRQLRELQELEELEKSKAATTSSLPTYDDIESEEESEEEIQAVTKPAGGFGAVSSSFALLHVTLVDSYGSHSSISPLKMMRKRKMIN